jgi:LmbE family N-acetylglucosaminyl deacetylase
MKQLDIKFGRYSVRELVKKVINPLILFYRQRMLLLKLQSVEVSSIDKYKRIIIIAPHPDDEVIGIGGFLLQQQNNETEIFIIYLTDGEGSLPNISPEKISKNRIKLSETVLNEIHIPMTKVRRMHLPDGNVPHENDNAFQIAVEDLSNVIAEIRPDAVFVSYIYDMHEDHVAAFQIVREVLKSREQICDLYGYWVWLWYLIPIKYINKIDWANTNIIKIDAESIKKKMLMDLYLKPQADNGDPWSGNLPAGLLHAFTYPHEVITKCSFKI